MSEENIKNKISEILNIENNPAWNIIDKDEDTGLYLIHDVPLKPIFYFMDIFVVLYLILIIKLLFVNHIDIRLLLLVII